MFAPSSHSTFLSFRACIAAAAATAAAAAATPGHARAPSDVRACFAFPAWMHNYLAALHPRLQGCSGFELVKLARSLADLGYKPARPFLADFAAAVEVRYAVRQAVVLFGTHALSL
jgi:hypothetical protein